MQISYSRINYSYGLQHAAILVRHKHIQCFASLLYGSSEHCDQITVDDANRLADTIDILTDSRLFRCIPNEKPYSLMLVSDLCTILYPILQYGLREVTIALRSQTSLLKSLPEAIRFLLPYGKELADPCIRFYTMLMRSIFTDCKAGYVSETEQFVTLPIINNVQSGMVLDAKGTELKLTRDTTLNLDRDLISSYFELNRTYHDVLSQAAQSTTEKAEELLNKEWEAFDRKKLELDHARLKQDNDSMQEELSRLHDELQRTRSERDQFELNIEHTHSMNEVQPISLASSTVPLQPSVLPDLSNNKNLDLENVLPSNITREQAESFIQEIYHRRVTFNDHDMRKSICGSLKHLGSDLYSSPVHFLHELIQVLKQDSLLFFSVINV